MPWNWALPEWPNFRYNFEQLSQEDKQFLLEAGKSSAFLKSIDGPERNQFIVEILTTEGVESSKIEGELLDRKSLQSSIKRHFGIQTLLKKEHRKEAAMARLLCEVYGSFDQPLTHEMLFHWHAILFQEEEHLADVGQYRTHPEPMQIVASRYDSSKVFFEAPPSHHVTHEMTRFIEWFNASTTKSSLLGQAAIAHVYFESIHPFEDGNGRIGRALVEKILSRGVGRPILIAVSKVLEKDKKNYYLTLEKCNKTLDVQHWVGFFAHVILQAQKESLKLLDFLVEKTKLLSTLSGQLNTRQEKVLLRMFAAGVDGFQGGLSAENYLSITKTSRATATRDLADLVQKGALVKTGELRHARYWLNLFY